MTVIILKDHYQNIRQRLMQNGTENAALDARLLMCHELHLTHEAFVLQGNDALSAQQIAEIESLVTQRLAGRPVAKIIGYKEFYGRDFITTDDTLDPRPDSEVLIETVLRYVTEKHAHDVPLRILDLGTGTGCLILTLLAELPHAMGVAVDQSASALSVARDNAAKLGLDARMMFLQSDWLQNVTGEYDIIISNPPYIPKDEIAGLAVDVREFDPLSALVGGADGLDPYRIIIPALGSFLKPAGFAAFELGQGQDDIVAEMLQKVGFDAVSTSFDLAGIGRVVSGIYRK